MLSQDQVKKLFDYREDGYLIRKNNTSGPCSKKGMVVGYIPKSITRNNRYITTKISGKHWCVHRLIFLWHNGYIPDQIDHINRNTLDNRIENLRETTASQNICNRKLFSNNTSGMKGVHWHKHKKKWFVYVDINKKRKSIGYFDDIELAELVSIEAREKYHKSFANHI